MIGYVIQEIGLFPHFTVARNIGVVPQIEGWPEDEFSNGLRNCCNSSGLSRNWHRVIRVNSQEDSGSESAWPGLWLPIRRFC